MNKLRIIGILLGIIAIMLFCFGGVSDVESVLIALNCMLIGINVATWSGNDQ